MNICIFDTETTSLDKPFCYNIGYIIVNTENWETIVSRSFVVEQIWHNLPLFSTAYYAEKRELYVKSMRARKTVMDKFGYICRNMHADFRQNNVEMAFAYNSSFDEKVFNFNCDWFKCLNPFDSIEIKDIRGFVHEHLINNEYKNFCEEQKLFTDSGNYSSTAEAVYRFITKNTEFIESHTALEDSEIESEILHACVRKGANLLENPASKRSIVRHIEKELHIITKDKNHFCFPYKQMKMNKARTEITLK